MIPLYQTRFFLYNRKGKHKFKKGSKSMREPICHKRNFHFTITCMALLLLLALVGCGNKNTQKDGSLQGNNTTQNQETQGEAGQDAQGTGNQDSQGGARQDTQGTGNLDSQSTAGQDTQGPGNPGSQGTSSQDGQNTANQDGQNTANQGGQSGLANQPKIALPYHIPHNGRGNIFHRSAEFHVMLFQQRQKGLIIQFCCVIGNPV